MGKIQFTALGSSGTGKTCFLVGMYYEMRSGIEGYTLTVKEDSTDVMLRNQWKKMCDINLGARRFPQGTDQAENYEFQLNYSYKKIKEFGWYDYRGGLIEEKGIGSNYEDYEEFCNLLKISTCLFICVNGRLLCGGDEDSKLRNVKDKCSGSLNDYIQKYADDHKEGLPPIVLMITQYDTCRKDVDSKMLVRILKKAFSGLFTDDGNNAVLIIPVAIGIIGDDNTGEINPMNIHIPLFFGMWYAMKKEYEKDNVEKRLADVKEQLICAKGVHERKKKYRLLYRKKKQNKANEEIKKLEHEVRNLENKKRNHQEYFSKLRKQLDERNLKVYINGEERKLDDIKFS